MFYTYILQSKVVNRTYVGSTNDLQKRLQEHNSGESRYTSKYRPWKLFHHEKFKTLAEVRLREKYLKSCAGRKYIKKLFDNIIPR